MNSLVRKTVPGRLERQKRRELRNYPALIQRNPLSMSPKHCGVLVCEQGTSLGGESGRWLVREAAGRKPDHSTPLGLRECGIPVPRIAFGAIHIQSRWDCSQGRSGKVARISCPVERVPPILGNKPEGLEYE